MREVTVGIDIGTSAVKVVAADGDGNVVASARVPHDSLVDSPGRLEHDALAALAALGDLDLRGVSRARGPDGDDRRSPLGPHRSESRAACGVGRRGGGALPALPHAHGVGGSVITSPGKTRSGSPERRCARFASQVARHSGTISVSVTSARARPLRLASAVAVISQRLSPGVTVTRSD